MCVYHFENGQLVKLCDSIKTLVPSDSTSEVAWHRVGFSVLRERPGAYDCIVRVADPGSDDGKLGEYAYVFLVESEWSPRGEYTWTILVRDDLHEYLEAKRLLQPLLLEHTDDLANGVFD